MGKWAQKLSVSITVYVYRQLRARRALSTYRHRLCTAIAPFWFSSDDMYNVHACVCACSGGRRERQIRQLSTWNKGYETIMSYTRKRLICY